MVETYNLKKKLIISNNNNVWQLVAEHQREESMSGLEKNPTQFYSPGLCRSKWKVMNDNVLTVCWLDAQ